MIVFDTDHGSMVQRQTVGFDQLHEITSPL